MVAMHEEGISKDYRPVKIEFLENTGNDRFDIYYKTKTLGSTRFVKFVSSNPNHKEKIRKMLETGMCEEDFYVHESDLLRYYGHATKSLRTFVSDPTVTVQEKAKKVYDVSKGIMKDFFEYNASPKVLEASGEVMEIMDDCLSKKEVGFRAIAEIVNRDYYTYTHSVNVGLYCMTFGIKNKMNPEVVRQLGLGGMLHDVGKSKIRLELINKDGKLTDAEFQEMKRHANFGVEILTAMRCYRPCVTQMVAQHHENYKGGGYPKGLAGDEISVHGRICKLMDVYDALTTRRSYKKAMTPLDALTVMKTQMSLEFDPVLLNKFIALMGPER